MSTVTKQSLTTVTGATSMKPERGANQESITFIWLDIRRESTSAFVGALRNINDCVRIYSDVQTCLESLRSSNERIFLISSLSDNEFLSATHSYTSVDALFVLDADANVVRGDLPKLIGVFTQQEELLRVLKETWDYFEKIQLEAFVFQTDDIFLWWQLWKEEITARKPAASGKTKLIEQARNYYRNNPKRLKLIEDFENTYRTADSLRWCFRVPFPSRPFRHALLSRATDLLSLHQFLIYDVIRTLQQSKRTGQGQLYRGMKLSNSLVELFETNTGKLVCVNGFFACSKARNAELQAAASPAYRPDLVSVLFKIDFDSSARFGEVTLEDGSTSVIFDVATSFRVLCVNRGAMSVIKLKTAPDDGKRFALEYKEQHKGKTIQMLLYELSAPPPPPPAPVKAEPKKETVPAKNSEISEDELRARKHLNRGEIDEAIAAYRRIRPMPVRILKVIGQLSVEEKQDYDTALECYRQALKLEEETGDNTTDSLSRLGALHHRRGEYESALKFYTRVLVLLESTHPRDKKAIAFSLTGISNAHRARKELNEALDYAQRAWTLYESTDSENDEVVAKSLNVLTNIHHELGDDSQALKLGTRALALSERMQPSNLSQSAELLNTLGLIQTNLGDVSEARHYFERSLKIYNHIAPLGQSEKAKVQQNLQHVLEMQVDTDKSQHYS